MWHRRDFLSSIELCTIADAINSFPSYTEWLLNYKNAIHNQKDIDIISQSYEIISASMFNNGKQVVELCELSNPGFDFKINIENKLIRVSCKKLQTSDREKNSILIH